MKQQIAIVSLTILVLASILGVDADFPESKNIVNYSGSVDVKEGRNWFIECYIIRSDEKIFWTRDGEEPEELTSGDIVRYDKPERRSSRIVSYDAKKSHEGYYKCTSYANTSFYLMVIRGPK